MGSEESETRFFTSSYRALLRFHLDLLRQQFDEETARQYAEVLAAHDVRWMRRRLDPSDQFGQFIAHENKVLEDFLRGESGRLLDIGAGYGRLIRAYRSSNLDVVALDADPAARAILAERGVEARDAEVTRLPFEDGEFDVLVMMLVIHEIPEEKRPKALAECSRVLKRGGLAIIGEHRAEGFDPDWLLEVLPEYGFRVEDVDRRNWWFVSGERERVLMKCRKVS